MEKGDKIVYESEDGFDIAIIDNICEQNVFFTFITGIFKGEQAKLDADKIQMHTELLEKELRKKTQEIY